MSPTRFRAPAWSDNCTYPGGPATTGVVKVFSILLVVEGAAGKSVTLIRRRGIWFAPLARENLDANESCDVISNSISGFGRYVRMRPRKIVRGVANTRRSRSAIVR